MANQHSTNDDFIKELFNPVCDGEPKNPTVVAVLIAVRCTAILASEMSEHKTYNTECFCDGEPLGTDPDQRLLLLKCGHVGHFSCILESINGEKTWEDPDVAGEISDEADEIPDEVDEIPDEVDEIPISIVQSPRVVEIDRFCPMCRTVILPNLGYDWSDAEHGIPPLQAGYMLDYFQDPTFGEERLARLDDPSLTAAEIAAALSWSLDEARNSKNALKRRWREYAEVAYENWAEYDEGTDEYETDEYEPKCRLSKRTKRKQAIVNDDAVRKAQVKPRTNLCRRVRYLREHHSSGNDVGVESNVTTEREADATSDISELTEYTTDKEDARSATAAEDKVDPDPATREVLESTEYTTVDKGSESIAAHRRTESESPPPEDETL